jgi:hypothetical protein
MTDIAKDVQLGVQESDVGTIHVRIEAGKKLRKCHPYTELHPADVGLADEVKSKRSVNQLYWKVC